MSIKNYEVCEHCRRNFDCEYDVDTDLYLCYYCWDKVKFTWQERLAKHWDYYKLTYVGVFVGGAIGTVVGVLIRITLAL